VQVQTDSSGEMAAAALMRVALIIPPAREGGRSPATIEARAAAALEQLSYVPPASKIGATRSFFSSRTLYGSEITSPVTDRDSAVALHRVRFGVSRTPPVPYQCHFRIHEIYDSTRSIDNALSRPAPLHFATSQTHSLSTGPLWVFLHPS
jgi:hypothetical protein